jgi:hypothetical protein
MRNPKMGSNQSIIDPPINDFFKKLLSAPKIIKLMDVLFIFYFFNNICAQVRPVLKNAIAGLPGSLEKLQKY